MTDITELAQREKFEAWVMTQICISKSTLEGLRTADGYRNSTLSGTNYNRMWDCWKAAGAELVEALEKAQQQIIALQQRHEVDPRTHEIIDLKERIDNLESFRTAYMEWGDKTDWMQTDKRFDFLKPWGKHRADVLKAYIEHLESRTVTVKLPSLPYLGAKTIWYQGFAAGAEGMRNDCAHAITAAGIKVEAE
ncbi:hypothetical protein [Klebsiella quasipneumoniae]|uniref:hypothetical protein n=1 Tax=Klebsiella quasipneumoniae TaxID=1463165 RepID=UPI003B281C19